MISFLYISIFLSAIFTFDTLPKAPQEIEIRGFLYNQEENWILADKPNQKSCCIKKNAHLKIKNLNGNFSSSKVYLIKGMLLDQSTLEKAKIVEEEKNGYIPVFIMTLFMFLMWCKRNIFKLASQKLRS